MFSDTKKERLAKRIASAGLCSRRDAEKLILAGEVTVNGNLITTPAFNVDLGDIIQVKGKELKVPSLPRLWIYYKPVGLITTHKDPEGRPTVFESLPDSLPRVISIGRLDLNSEGLLLLTTSSALSRYAELPSHKWARTYRVRVFGIVDESKLAALKNGITIDGIHYGRIDAELSRQSGKNAWLIITLYEGKNREIRRVMEYLELRVNRLIRLSYGPFKLNDLGPSEIKEVPWTQIKQAFPELSS